MTEPVAHETSATRLGAGERLAAAVHAVHGTRGISLAGGLLLLMAAVEPFLFSDFPRILYALPLGALLFVGLATLPREGVAANERARRLLESVDAPRRMARRALWGALLCVALLPNLFLAVQGVPHLSPIAGVAAVGLVRTIAVVGLLAVLLLAVQYLRTSQGYAPEVRAQRPRALRADSGKHVQRELIMVLMWVVVVAWAWLLRAFWSPFSLLQWNGTDIAAYLESFALGARALAGVAFTVVPPVLLFLVLSAHLGLIREIHRRQAWRQQGAVAALAVLHAFLAVSAAVLHAYNLFWFVRYRSLGFL